MRSSLIIATAGAAAAADTEAPKITLDLSDYLTHTVDGTNLDWDAHGLPDSHTEFSGHKWAGAFHSVRDPADGTEPVDYSNPRSSTNNGRPFQTVTCLATTSHGPDAHTTTATNCPEPVAKAWDHHDGDISAHIQKCPLLLIKNDGGVMWARNTALDMANDCKGDADADYVAMRNHRSEWLFKYNVVDRAGNAAETVSFSMVFVDNEPPRCLFEAGGQPLNAKHDMTSHDYNTEAGDLDAHHQKLTDRRYNLVPLDYTCVDSFDGPLTTVSTVTYTCPGESASTFTRSMDQHEIDTHKEGEHKFEVHSEDMAGMFGVDGANNPTEFDWIVTVQDTTAPEVTCAKAYCHVAVGTAATVIARVTENLASYPPKFASIVDDTNAEDCCQSCVNQHKGRVIGTQGNPNACTHVVFESTSSYTTCNHYSGVPTLTSGNENILIPMTCDRPSTVDEHWECGESFLDYGAWCTDINDDYETATSVLPVAVPDAHITHDVSNVVSGYSGLAPTAVDGKYKGTFEITYTCTDDAQITNSAKRTTVVRDTTPPTLKITTVGHFNINRYTKYGNGYRHAGHTHDSTEWNMDTDHRTHSRDSHIIQHSAGYLKDLAIIQDLRTLNTGMMCLDTCEKYATSVTTTWTPEFNNILPGTYVLKYVCEDGQGHQSIKSRTVVNEDKTKPVIRILGQDLMTLEATHDGNYVDDGATCSDQVDGMISENVEVSGDVVNLSTLGRYTISYNCKDSAGNAADTAIRIVYVRQTSCPTCSITGDGTITREASFPYYDQGAACTDLLEGSVHARDDTNPVNVERTGEYSVTYRAINSIGLWNDDSTCRYGKQTYTRTVVVIDTLKPVITLKYSDAATLYSKKSNQASNQHTTSGSNPNPNDHPLSVNDKNPADSYSHTWMAESAQTSSVNGWVVGAIGSAVTGLALLGYSMRKTSVATSVPV